MASSSSDDTDEKPLDPAVERFRQRLSRLMLVAGLTLGLGILAVFGAILYKIGSSDSTGGATVAWRPGEAVPTLARSETGLPAGARLVSATRDGRTLVLTFEHPGGNSVLFVTADTFKVTGRLDIAGE